MNQDAGATPLFTTIHREQRRSACVLPSMRRSITLVILGLTAVGCSKTATKQPIPPTPTESVEAPAASKDTTPPPSAPNVSVSDEIAKQCRLRFENLQATPKFGYDDEELLPADRDMLQQVANCLTRGPLKNAKVDLVGRTDPRGTDEYNLALGNRRAYSVRAYLQRLGVPPDRLSPTTRGEIDATGAGEMGWQTDRRVDLQLAN